MDHGRGHSDGNERACWKHVFSKINGAAIPPFFMQVVSLLFTVLCRGSDSKMRVVAAAAIWPAE